MITPEERFYFAKNLCRDAGKLAHSFFQRRDQLVREAKANPQDLASEADLAVEQYITRQIREAFPDDGFFGEETGVTHGKNNALWLTDPIDGTANFLRGMAYYAVSIAFVNDNELLFGAIYDPEADELFTALKGQGAWLNGDRMQVSRPQWSEAMIGLGRSDRHRAEIYHQAVPALLTSGAEYRRQGAGALSLAHVAAGKIDAYVEPHMNPWDATAGLLIAAEAGAITEPYMHGDWHQGGLVYAASPSIDGQLKKTIPFMLED